MRVIPTALVIKLDQFQYTFYKKSRLETQSPTGEVLTVISKPLTVATDEDAIYQVYCQTPLLEVLFYEVNERVKLPQRAINSITQVLSGLMDI